MSVAQEFKSFILKGDVVDMAVGIIIGGAFGKVVASLVKDIIMPPIGVALGGVDFGDLAVTLQAATQEAQAVTLNYGSFIMTIIDFLIIGLAIFVGLKVIESLKENTAAQEEKAGPSQEELLTEIRDLLRK